MRFARTPTTNTLITIPISHFCEKARWALERGGIPYEEQRHIQGPSIVAVMRFGGRTTPLLAGLDGVFADSTDILEYVNRAGTDPGFLYPSEPAAAKEVRELEEHFDEGLGPDGRLWMYYQLVDQSDKFLEYAPGVPAWERRAFPLLWAIARPALRRRFSIDDDVAAQSLANVEAVFEEVGRRLADGRSYLVGNDFTAADLSFAALSAAVLMPKNYGVPLPQPDQLPEPMAAKVLELRSLPAGQFAARMYEHERRAKL